MFRSLLKFGDGSPLVFPYKRDYVTTRQQPRRLTARNTGCLPVTACNEGTIVNPMSERKQGLCAFMSQDDSR